MNAELSSDSLAGLDVLIHGAFIRAERAKVDASEANIRATRALFEASKRNGTKFVFISTILARPDAESHYALHKCASERMLAEREALVIRPGLVIGDGGLLRSLYLSLQRGFTPLIDGGTQAISIVGTEDLASAISVALESRLRGRQTVCAEDVVQIKEIARTLAERFGLKAHFLSVPWVAAYIGASVAERLRIPLPLTRETLLGMRGSYAEAPSIELVEQGWRAKTWPELLPALSFEL